MTKKKWVTKCNGKIIKHGQAGVRIGKKGSARWVSYCARAKGIAKKYPNARKPCSPNQLSIKKWKC